MEEVEITIVRQHSLARKAIKMMAWEWEEVQSDLDWRTS
jgi:hypothetical protein